MRASRVLKTLREGGSVLCTQIGTGSEMLAGMASKIGYDCLWVDTEHKCVSEQQVQQCIQAARYYDTDCVVRIRKESYCSYFRPLEDGAAGIMVPHCITVEDAELAVRNAKFYPQGLRGMDFSGAGADYMVNDPEECAKWMNRETFVMIQIEDKEAVDNIEALAAVDGVDMFFIGPQDLKQSYLRHGETDGVLDKVAEKIAGALQGKTNKWWGLPVASVEQMKKYRDMGARFFNMRGDLGTAFKGWKEIYDGFKGV